MAKRTTLNSSKQSDALIISKLDFISKLKERIKIGIEILNRPITNIDQLDKIEIDYSKWDDYNVEFLKIHLTMKITNTKNVLLVSMQSLFIQGIITQIND